MGGDVEQPNRHFLNFMGQFRRQHGSILDREGDEARRENPCMRASSWRIPVLHICLIKCRNGEQTTGGGDIMLSHYRYGLVETETVCPEI